MATVGASGVVEFLGKEISSRVKTMELYEGTHSNSSAVDISGNVYLDSAFQNAYTARVNKGALVKWYNSLDRTVQLMAAGDDGSLIVGFIESEMNLVNTSTGLRVANVYFFGQGDIVKMYCDATHNAIAVGDAVDIDAALSKANTNSMNKGFSIKPAENNGGFGYALNSLAANTAGYIAVAACKRDVKTMTIQGLDANAAALYPIGHVPEDCRIMAVRAFWRTNVGNGTWNLEANEPGATAVNLFAAEQTDASAADTSGWYIPDQNTDVDAGTCLSVDTSVAVGAASTMYATVLYMPLGYF